MKMLERMRLQAEIKNISLTAPTGTSPLLKKQLEQTQEQLNSILTKWKFGDTPITSANEFINNFEPWINNQLEQQKDLKVFLSKKGVKSLEEANTQLTNRDLSESEELKAVRQELAQQKELWNNTEQDYLKRIEELNKEVEKKKGWSLFGSSLSEKDKEKLAEYDNLETERDEAIRDKKTLEQQNLSLNNGLKNKQQEVNNKEKALEKLKKEKNQLEIQQQKALKEKNSLITTLNQEIKEHKEKYTKQGKLLDTEQLECKKWEEENEKLTTKIKDLEKQNSKMAQRLLELDPPKHVDL